MSFLSSTVNRSISGSELTSMVSMVRTGSSGICTGTVGITGIAPIGIGLRTTSMMRPGLAYRTIILVQITPTQYNSRTTRECVCVCAFREEDGVTDGEEDHVVEVV